MPSKQTVTVELEREEAERLVDEMTLFHYSDGRPPKRYELDEYDGALKPAIDKLRAALASPQSSDEEAGELVERLWLAERRDDIRKALADCEAQAVERFKERLMGIERELREFDAWLSFRGEFSEVLTAFRKAFGDRIISSVSEEEK